MLGRSVGISDEKLAHVMDDPLPEGLFPDDEAAIVRFARASTRMDPIDDDTWGALTQHYDTRQIMEIIFTVGLNQMITRMHAAIRTEVDETTLAAVGGDSCPVRLPPVPGEAGEAGEA